MLEEDGIMFSSKSDTEVILYMLARYYTGDIVEAIKLTMDTNKGCVFISYTNWRRISCC